MSPNKEIALTLIKRIYSLVKNDQCVLTDDAVDLLRRMSVQELNKTESAKYLGIAVSTFNKLVASGEIPCGSKKANECLKWSTDDLDRYKSKHNKV